MLPKMSYKEIVNMLEIPELNINYCLLSKYAQDVVDNDGMLIVYTWKKDYEDSISRWFNSEFLRNKNGLILFVPKSYKDYRKLCDYLGDEIDSQKDDGIRNAQMESLKYLTNLIHEVQDKHNDGMNGSCHWCLEMTPYQFEMCWDATSVNSYRRMKGWSKEKAVSFIEDYKQGNFEKCKKY